MRDNESPYEAAGKCLEIAQQLEYYVATALMAADGLRSGSHIDVRDAAYIKLVSRLDRLTIGQALKELTARVPRLVEYEAALLIALDPRNRLAHEVFQMPIAELSSERIRELSADLQNLRLDLGAGYRAAFAIASSLVSESMLAKVAASFSGPPSSAVQPVSGVDGSKRASPAFARRSARTLDIRIPSAWRGRQLSIR